MRHPTLFKYGLYLPVTAVMAPQLTSALRFLTGSQRWPTDRRDELRAQRLRAMVQHLASRIPYYREALTPESVAAIQTPDDVTKLPFMTKAVMQEHAAALADPNPGRFLTTKTTGGSTGEPLTIPKTRLAMSWELAATWRGFAWAGVGIGDRQARFWGSPLDRKSRWRAWLIDLMGNRKRCSAFDFNEASLERYHQELAGFRPAYWYGYVSMLQEYAEFLLRKNLRPSPGLRCVITTSEVLTPSHRELFQEALGVRAFNEYGCGELGTIAHECEAGSLHLSDENMIVEFLNEDTPVAPGEPGELVVTELNNTAMPLIRYRTGDFATRLGEPCDCGRTLTGIRDIFGRAYDLLHSNDGRVFHAEFMMYIFEEAKRRNLGIGQFQVVQTALDSFTMRIVREADYGPPTEAFITQQIHEKFDPKATVSFEPVDEIRREPSGKLRVIVGLGPQRSPA